MEAWILNTKINSWNIDPNVQLPQATIMIHCPTLINFSFHFWQFSFNICWTCSCFIYIYSKIIHKLPNLTKYVSFLPLSSVTLEDAFVPYSASSPRLSKVAENAGGRLKCPIKHRSEKNEWKGLVLSGAGRHFPKTPIWQELAQTHICWSSVLQVTSTAYLK